MNRSSRRDFLADVGRGMLLASVGTAIASDLGIGPALGAEGSKGTLTFGDLEPLVGMIQDTPAGKLLPLVVQKMKDGVDTRQLVAAAALANARTFGGQDYVGFHTFMALAPAWHMSQELPSSHRPLPILKVLYRNADRIQQFGGRSKEILHEIEADEHAEEGGVALQKTTRSANYKAAEGTFAAMAKGPMGEAFNHLQFSVQDEVDVHRVVLAWRAWDSLDLTGQEHAHTLLRQSVRYCVEREEQGLAKGDEFKNRVGAATHIRQVLPKMLDQYGLLSKPLGTRRAEDGWIREMSRTIVESNSPKAADAAAAALAEGIAPQDLAEAISLAANELLLRDTSSRTHGDSKGVHASDSANAWRNIARVSNHRNTVASLIVGAYHTAGQSGKLHDEPYPHGEHLEKLASQDPAALLKQADTAIRENNQALACAAVHRYGELGHDSQGVFELLLKFAISEDGRLHAEKYFRTVQEEFAQMRPAFRWRQLTALARVTASQYGYNREDKHGFRAPGYDEACRLLGVEA